MASKSEYEESPDNGSQKKEASKRSTWKHHEVVVK
jgi:hypothetical protein